MKLLVGYGNTMRQDDGVGWLIASQLAPQFAESDVQVVCVHQLMPEIAATIAAAEKVIFVDAAIGEVAGQVTVSSVVPQQSIGSAHFLRPAEVLYIADYLYNQLPPAFLVTITGEQFDLGETLSASTTAAIPVAIDNILQLLA